MPTTRFLSGHAYQDGKWEHRGDFAQEADLVFGICGAHGGYETAEVCDVRRIGGGRGLRGVPGKRGDGIFLGQPQGEERFMAKWIAAEKARAGLLRYAVVCPNVMGRTRRE